MDNPLFAAIGRRLPSIVGALAASSLIAAAPVVAQQQEVRASGPAAGARTGDHNTDVPMANAVRRVDQIDLDGRIEAAWNAGMIAGATFTQTEPDEGAAPSEKTDLYVMYDDDALYIAARLWDETGNVSKRLARRDSFLMDSDWFNVMLDTHHAHVSAYQFSVNPSGVKRDEVTSGGRMGDASWDVVWQAESSVDAEGWSVEIRIPFSQLRFSSEDVQTWGVQFQRRINRLQEVSVFSFTPRGQAGGVARYGHLTGLEKLKAGKRLEAMPYSLGNASYVNVSPNDPFHSSSSYGRAVGADVLYRLTTSLTLNATVNPDFGQVEVDPAVVNLTAFETSFMERRPFFVEGADLFRFGVSSGAAMGPGGAGGGGGGGMMGGGGGMGGTQLVYSRRIGRAPQGSLPSGVLYSDVPETATIFGAAKITGRTLGGWSLGLLDATTQRESAPWVDGSGLQGSTIVEPATNYLVGRALKDLRAGQTQVGILATAVNRSLGDATLESLLRSNAYTGGIDFSHEFLNRSWSVEGQLAMSHVEGSTAAMIRTQQLSSRYFQRPDASHVDVDSAATSMQGYTARLEVGKRAGLHWRGEASVAATSPGFEINDMGFLTGVDRVNTNLNVTYMQSTPQGWFRNYRINGGPQSNWNYDGDMLSGRFNVGLNGQLKNFWGGGLNFGRKIVGFDDRLTRGGPIVKDKPNTSIGGNIMSDQRKAVTLRLNGNYSWGQDGDKDRRLGGNVQLRPSDSWTISFGPSFNRSTTFAQYVTSIGDGTATATFGRRYLFTELEQSSVSMDTRLNVNFSPELSLELFAQPLISSGDYGALKELEAPRLYQFLEYGKDRGTITYDEANRRYVIDPDGTGPASTFNVSNRDFNQRTLRGNAVLRWEYRPGSTLFLVWQQSRTESLTFGDFDFGRDVGGLFDATPDNFFVVKLNYWLNF